MNRPMPKADIEINEKFRQAYQLIEETDKNVLITGQAGTGKSTFLQYVREHTQKNVVVLAPTGVAAVNINGQTIHSFFYFKPDITPESVHTIKIRKDKRDVYKHVDLLIIDEISMVRADLLDCIDQFLQLHGKHPGLSFGGIQIVFVGDLYQLPPVVNQYDQDVFRDVYQSPYFFHAKSYNHLNMERVELDQIYRQDEKEFIDILFSLRTKNISQVQLNKLNERLDPNFQPDEKEFYVYLTPTNALADEINRKRLSSLEGRVYRCEGSVFDKFEERSLPTHLNLELKAGAQVMLLNNDNQGRWINGTIGKILNINEDAAIVDVELEDGECVSVTPFTWEMFRVFFDEGRSELVSETVGSFTQYPLRLAWAVTIHKSQGKTFSKVILDMGRGAFSHGQTYVALSRCTSLQGLILKRPIYHRDILLDQRVVDFFANRADKASAETSLY
jgi:ATP-dependent DNA helicase PIF1